MTRKQFKEGLLRGQGRCIQAAQAEPELYYDLVLWACSLQLPCYIISMKQHSAPSAADMLCSRLGNEED